LRETLGRPDLDGLVEICRAVEDAIEAHGGDEPFDDAAFLAIRFRETASGIGAALKPARRDLISDV